MTGRLLTLPNGLTALRLALMPLLAIFIEVGWGYSAAVVIFCAAVTDWFDGWTARKLKQESQVGKLMDPVADKVFLVVAIIFLMARTEYPEPLNADPQISAWLVTLILSREFLVSGLRSMAQSVGLIMGASKTAKWKTTFQFLGLGFLAVGGRLWGLPMYSIGNSLLWISVVLSYLSMASYTLLVFQEFQKKKLL